MDPIFHLASVMKKQYLLYMGMAIILGVIFISVEKQLLRLLYGLKSYCLSKK